MGRRVCPLFSTRRAALVKKRQKNKRAGAGRLLPILLRMPSAGRRLACRRRVNGRLVWPVCVAAPLVCAWADWAAPRYWGYTFGYELLMVNGLLTIIGLLLISRRAPRD